MNHIMLTILSNMLNINPSFDISEHEIVKKIAKEITLYLIIFEKDDIIHHRLYSQSDLSINDIELVEEGCFEPSANGLIQILKKSRRHNYFINGYSFKK
jgi:hypothetical protein